MLSRQGFVVVAGLVVMACAGETGDPPATDTATAQVPAPTADEAAIDQVRTDYVTHYNMHHASVVADLYADSAMWLDVSGAVHMGKAELLASLEAEIAGSPTLTLTSRETMVFGDHAVDIGDYTASTTLDGTAANFAGTYLTYLQRQDGQWKIAGGINNFSAPPAVPLPAPTEEEETPPDAGTMQEFTAAYVQAFNASDWAALGAMVTDDAKIAFSQAPLIEGGPAAVQARYTERFGAESSPMIEIHDVGTQELADGWALDGGWFTFSATTPEGRITQTGMYLSVVQRQPDGSWKMHWHVSNGTPQPAAQ